MSDTSSVISPFQKIADQSGAIDVLIHNAFYLTGQDPLSMTDEEWSYGIEGTLNTIYRTVREVIPYLKKSKAPRILNAASMQGMLAPDLSFYEDTPEFLYPPPYRAAT